ncbi:endonuclease/exonuclease/phosphatase family protein [Ectothiorhodospiraceae bacterium 2226]|nr:endonuclease/exonuclease/phosphatase family protein [Ectothiorhodospiraceae bacterium 2226]
MSQDAGPIEQRLPSPGAGQRLRLLSYNVQVGIATARAHEYLTASWKHVLPHSERLRNLDRTADILGDFDIVGLQELDAGSLRSGFINLTEYLALRAGFPYWHHQVNRRLGKLAQHANGLLSRYKPTEIVEYSLPGFIKGRGAIMASYGPRENPLVLFFIHLALSQRARANQLAFISELVNEHKHVALMGDLNCTPRAREMDILFKRTHLVEPLPELHTFPSWCPIRNIDHILVSPELEVREARVLNHICSDHLPISTEIVLPPDLILPEYVYDSLEDESPL